MPISDFTKVLAGKKNVVLIGEAGSGKTETALNVAEQLARAGYKTHLFDMDQTKPLFRARDVSDAMEDAGVVVHYQHQLLDLPTLVPAVRETLLQPELTVVMDVGGNENGARMVGQFSGVLNNENTVVYYVVNPYRPWSTQRDEMLGAMAFISSCVRVANLRLMCNPCLGHDTTLEEAVSGVRKYHELLGEPCDFVLIRDSISGEAAARIPEPVLPLRLYIEYE